MMGARQHVLRFDRVGCVRGGRALFAGVSFDLSPGQALHIVGPNGIGKSSLLRLAAGLLEPAAGTIIRDAALALADERPALDPSRTLIDALDYWAAIDGGDAKGALAAVGLAHLSPVPVRMLSTGQRRRATMARVIASGAPLWLLDEPVNGLDGASVRQLEALVTAHLASGGSALIASHQPLAIAGMAALDLGAHLPGAEVAAEAAADAQAGAA